MRHRKSGRKLGRNSSHRKAMFRNMLTSLVMHGRIKTTEAKAKELRKYADKVITLGKRVPLSSLEGLSGEALAEGQAQRLHAIRQAARMVHGKDAIDRIFNEYAPRFADRPGGYTRIYKLGYRSGDNAPMTLIEFVDNPALETEPEVDSSAEEAPVEETAAE